jgi:tRNA 2-selenouridine synthase
MELARTAGSIVLDTRSPKEYAQGHIPQAVNLPLLDDQQRHQVGICYKEKGQEAAVELGFELVGPFFSQKIKEAKKLAQTRKVLIYCWRGGLRSNIMAWLLSTAGFEVLLLTGGYKGYRGLVLETLRQQRRFLVITGKTGSGKTELLKNLEQAGEHILDLEGLASHKGSSFGSLGQTFQTTQEHFENTITEILDPIPNDHSVFVEDESRRIGKLLVPDGIFNQIITAPCVELEIDSDVRQKRILEEYGGFDKSLLHERTLALARRMGPEKCKEAIEALSADNYAHWSAMMIDYYDKSYRYSFEKNPRTILFTVNSSGQEGVKAINEGLKL